MIEVDLRSVPEGASEYVAVARLTVNDDGSVTTWDPEEVIPFDIKVVMVDADQKPRWVAFDEDPESWARNLHRGLRTGYLVPVVTKDDKE